MINFLKAAITVIAELVIGVAWAIISIAGVVILFLLAYGSLAWLVQNF